MIWYTTVREKEYVVHAASPTEGVAHWISIASEASMNLHRMNGLWKTLSVLLIIVIIGSLILSALPV